MASGSGPGQWSNDRIRAAYDESRSVIEAQNDTMADIDDKAMRTVRLTALIIGILVTAGQVDPSLFHQELLRVSFGSFVLAAILGITTYDESDLYVGSEGEYLETFADNSKAGSDWDKDWVEIYAGMISENYDDLQHNARLLKYTQASLISGIILAVLSIVFRAVRPTHIHMSASSREKAREHGQKSGKGTKTLTRIIRKVRGSGNDSDE